ncbi:hypothetical protein F2P81_000105 [Scophthalmus maximus]|uniref:Uncharacterized protein n=1 Tax=Scophthalmus maximus TaxID=52904 RepID=A0A6A4TWP9_SCOMX|nr:hypothetical protein F2P81_000105 [Scophthalmus maximus]
MISQSAHMDDALLNRKKTSKHRRDDNDDVQTDEKSATSQLCGSGNGRHVFRSRTTLCCSPTSGMKSEGETMLDLRSECRGFGRSCDSGSRDAAEDDDSGQTDDIRDAEMRNVKTLLPLVTNAPVSVLCRQRLLPRGCYQSFDSTRRSACSLLGPKPLITSKSIGRNGKGP